MPLPLVAVVAVLPVFAIVMAAELLLLPLTIVPPLKPTVRLLVLPPVALEPEAFEMDGCRKR
jgi:hypothetical protein